MATERGWIQLATALRREFDGMIGRTQYWVIPAEAPTFAELLDLHDSTAGIAEAAGYGRPGQHKKGTQAYRDRESFMRSLRRYRDGTRAPDAARRRLIEGLGHRERRRQATPRDLAHVVELMQQHGLTFEGYFKIRYSRDEGERDLGSPGWWISPDIIEDEGLAPLIAGRHWAAAHGPFSNAVSRSYTGGRGIEVVEVETFYLQIGRARGAQAIET